MQYFDPQPCHIYGRERDYRLRIALDAKKTVVVCIKMHCIYHVTSVFLFVFVSGVFRFPQRSQYTVRFFIVGLYENAFDKSSIAQSPLLCRVIFFLKTLYFQNDTNFVFENKLIFNKFPFFYCAIDLGDHIDD